MAGDRVAAYLRALFDLTGRVALVTGGNQGIGLGIARALAWAGTHVVVGNRRAAGGAASAVALDVSRQTSAREVVAQAVRDHGGLDILVNNTGVLVRKPAEGLAEGEVESLLSVKVKGRLPRGPCRRGGGAAERAGPDHQYFFRRGYRGQPEPRPLHGYQGRSEPTHPGPGDGVAPLPHLRQRHRPGTIRTPINDPFLGADTAHPRGQLAQIPQGRLAMPDDVGALAVFLVSAATGHVMGQTIFVDGGRTTH